VLVGSLRSVERLLEPCWRGFIRQSWWGQWTNSRRERDVLDGLPRSPSSACGTANRFDLVTAVLMPGAPLADACPAPREHTGSVPHLDWDATRWIVACTFHFGGCSHVCRPPGRRPSAWLVPGFQTLVSPGRQQSHNPHVAVPVLSLCATALTTTLPAAKSALWGTPPCALLARWLFRAVFKEK
jgi:hypothetical protein